MQKNIGPKQRIQSIKASTANALQRQGYVALQLATGATGALIATIFSMPLPYLFGSLTASALLVQLQHRAGPSPRKLPQSIRQFFIAIVGIMIGQSFSPGFWEEIETLWVSLLGVVVYVTLAFGAGYFIFRKLGKLDRTTALFAAMPGGLNEAILMGEQANGNVRLIALQHFVRVILVVFLVPMSFLIVTGDVVGSAAGEQISQTTSDIASDLLAISLAPLGIFIGHCFRLPAKVLLGPILLTAFLQSTAIITITPSPILIVIAQIVIGTGLGSTFCGITLRELKDSLILGIVSVGTYLSLALVLALAISPSSPLPLHALFIIYAPGGVTEMSLIALSFHISPLIVAVHHILRISCTVIYMSFAATRISSSQHRS